MNKCTKHVKCDGDRDRNFLFKVWNLNKVAEFLKSVWRHSIIDYYNKASNTPYFAPWQLGDKLVLIVDLNATVRRAFTNLNATVRRAFTNLTTEYQKLWLEIGVGIDGQYKTWQIEMSVTLISSWHRIKKSDFSLEMQVNPKDSPPDNYIVFHVIKSKDDRLRECSRNFCTKYLPFPG